MVPLCYNQYYTVLVEIILKSSKTNVNKSIVMNTLFYRIIDQKLVAVSSPHLFAYLNCKNFEELMANLHFPTYLPTQTHTS